MFITKVLRHTNSVVKVQDSMPPATRDKHNIPWFLNTLDRQVTLLNQDTHMYNREIGKRIAYKIIKWIN